MKTHLEIETKYDVAAGDPLPDLVGAGGVQTMVAQAEQVLTATYFDTDDLVLLASRATLRRRTGGSDDGWHLKLSLADGERLELRRGLGRGQSPPVALTTLVRALVRSQTLRPVAGLVTHRTVHHLLDRDGLLLAELADDSVRGERYEADGAVGHTVTWRELEVELVAGEREALAELDAAVRASGAELAAGASKVGRVLGAGGAGGAGPGTTAARVPPRTGLRRKSRVGEVLDAGLRQSVLQLLTTDPLVRLDRVGATARMRAVLQRLRAALALCRQVVPDEAYATVRAELGWLDTVLLGVDELDAAGGRIREALANQPGERVLGPVGRRVDRELAAGRRRAVAEVREALDSDRYLALLDDVAALCSRTERSATRRSGEVLPDLADRAVRRAERRLVQLRRAQSDDERRWHVRGAQRAVERARYAELLAAGGAALEPGPGAGRLAGALAEAADVLRELDVSARTQELLREQAVQAHLAGENGFTFGLLHGLEHCRAVELHSRLRALRKQVKRQRKG